MFIEPEKEGDPFEVSDADTMLKYLDPKAKAPEPVVIFDARGCPHCARAKALLERAGYEYDEITLGGNDPSSTLVGAIAGAQTRAAGLHRRQADRRREAPSVREESRKLRSGADKRQAQATHGVSGRDSAHEQ